MTDILSTIVQQRRNDVELLKKQIDIKQLEQDIADCTLPNYSLADALAQSSTGIIAEFKRRSPSKQWINKGAEAKTITTGYANAGAAALSVLTEPHFFGGNVSDLITATENVNIPVLKKDFIVDELQILNARLEGASAILLIAAALSKDEVNNFTDLALQLQLDVLLELHDESELDYITPHHNIIGINNRNLGTFSTDIQKSFDMAKYLPNDAILVAESGISSPATVAQLRQAGYRGFLIGENFMKTDDPEQALAQFINQI